MNINYNIYLIIIIINLFQFINCENPIVNATINNIDSISPIQKQNKPNCLLYVGKLKTDLNISLQAPTRFAYIPFGNDSHSAVEYDVNSFGINDYIPQLIVVLDKTKVLNSFEYRVDENEANNVNNIYQLNIGGSNIKIDFKDTTNKYKKYYMDSSQALFYIDNKSDKLKLVYYYLPSNSIYLITSLYSVKSNQVADKIQCDEIAQSCYVYDGKTVYEFWLLSSLTNSISSFNFTFDLNECGVNGYGEKLLLSGNNNGIGYVYIYNKQTHNSKLLLNANEKIFKLALSYNSRYVGVITQTTFKFYLFDLQDESYETISNDLKINELYNGVYEDDLFKFTLSSIMPSPPPKVSSSSSSSTVNETSSVVASESNSDSNNNNNNNSSSSHIPNSSDKNNENNSTIESSSYISHEHNSSVSFFLLINSLLIMIIQIIIISF